MIAKNTTTARNPEYFAFRSSVLDRITPTNPAMITTVHPRNISADPQMIEENLEALKNFQNHPLHEAHKKRCRNLVCERLCGDVER